MKFYALEYWSSNENYGKKIHFKKSLGSGHSPCSSCTSVISERCGEVTAHDADVVRVSPMH